MLTGERKQNPGVLKMSVKVLFFFFKVRSMEYEFNSFLKLSHPNLLRYISFSCAQNVGHLIVNVRMSNCLMSVKI